jgi:hydroxyacylglutathione hydrolase
MILRRLYHDRLAQASYLIACEASREAIVIDPLRDPAPYLTAAEDEDVRIVAVAETHVHADFLSGAEALARVAGAELLLSADGSDESAARVRRTAARGLRHGDEISLGRVRLEARHTPGHTPEHLVFVVTDEAVSDLALGIATGDFLFVGDVGRPDLLERAVGIEGSMRGAAADLFRSLQQFRAFPEYVQIWPGHGAGSACGKSLGAVPQSTVGYEVRTNWAFQLHDEAEFVRAVLGDQPEPPAYFARMKRLNASGVPPMPTSGRADASALRARVEGDALVIDTRAPDEFLARHLTGSINVPLGRSTLTWAGSVLDPERDLVVLMSPGSLHEADDFVRDLALIGYDRVLGVLPARDLDTFAPRAVGTIATVNPRDLPARAGDARLIDVRTEAEWNEAHLPGAEHVPLAQLTARLDELRSGAPIVTYCQSGARSAVAASVLRASGIRDVSSLDGGFDAWLREAHVTSAEQGR